MGRQFITSVRFYHNVLSLLALLLFQILESKSLNSFSTLPALVKVSFAVGHVEVDFFCSTTLQVYLKLTLGLQDLSASNLELMKEHMV